MRRAVIASEAKQSILPRKNERMDCFFARNDGKSRHNFTTPRREAPELLHESLAL
jgi:hypothetical protein